MKLNWFLESKFNWGLNWINWKVEGWNGNMSFKPKLTLTTKTTLFHLNETMCFCVVLKGGKRCILEQNNVVLVNKSKKIIVQMTHYLALFIIFNLCTRKAAWVTTFQRHLMSHLSTKQDKQGITIMDQHCTMPQHDFHNMVTFVSTTPPPQRY
jgi:hypothetical protein